jgi:hypothetical protein
LPPPKPVSQAPQPGQRALPASVPPPPKVSPSMSAPARVGPSSIPASGPFAGRTPDTTVSPSSIPAPIVPVPVPLVDSVAGASSEEFYVKTGEDVRTLSLAEVKREVESGKLGPAALVCRVGDTEWRTVFDAAEFGLKVPRDEPSVTSVADSELLFEQPAKTAPRKRSGLASRAWQSLVRRNGKVTLVAWFVTGAVGLFVVLHQHGVLHRAASLVGMASAYETLEKDLLGGPGVGTVRGAKQSFKQSPAHDLVPFSKVEERVRGEKAKD